MPISNTQHAQFMQQAIRLATENVTSGRGGPFGCVIVRDGEVIAARANSVTATNDPTAHAEVNAIRAACAALGTFQLTGCDVYTSCEPCPMCLAAIYWARCRSIYFGNTAQDAAEAGFDDSFLYAEIQRPISERSIPIQPLLSDEAVESFNIWRETTERIDY
ncbi:nucleoside deaminase [Terriglobus saanensis]|uniref:Guanine deaminase n=1 Tax=Terriglobus saanensis (strain ATCC BAA-1853 / DSM 23119 / SP1PR4) TaxID=401053 RepID=E8UXZ5_TERSS|nr:nucleoside deaminase [Terriglobus saanensis]ADV84229.1 Guanine deaminase [Terriglobus saanensis SP1PR4]